MRRTFLLVLTCLWPTMAFADLQIGVAKTDVTPTTPIRLSGYAARKSESIGVAQPIYTRAIAIGTSKADASILMTLDSMAIPRELTETVAARLQKKTGLPRERFVLCGTHSHGAPCLTGAAINIFGHPPTPQEQAHIDAYTKEVTDKVEATALAALDDLKPGTLAIARGQVGFAANRRKPIAPGVPGPVDHEMPMLVAKNPDGSIRAVVANYACHCTTGGPDINKVHGDWAEFACDDMEALYQGAVALVTIGCGADANPSPRGTLALARQHGAEIASEVSRLLKDPANLKPITAPPAGQFKVIDLAFDILPTKEELETLAKQPTAAGANAIIQLATLQRDGKLPETIPYTLETWTFGDDLSMVFLAGETVVDYDLRLKHDFDPSRLWVSGYSNDVLCYIPSRRILDEGGYEAEGAMVYYARPARFAPTVENDIIRAVHSLLPTSLRTAKSLKEFPLPRSPEDSRKSIKVDGDMKVELVASEPLIESPVAIDWDLKGRLWVLEMYDYPSGLHDNNTPGGRVVILESTKHDGHYDKRTLFLDHLSYPQGLMCWRNGVLICAAPDILYAPDDNHDNHADTVKKLFSGFSPDNQQWEVNGLTWGLDNWVYGASSIHNDPIEIGETPPANANNQLAGAPQVPSAAVELGGRDFRMNPDTLAFEPAAGRTQFCRVRDDWGNWFGNDNSNSLWNYPLEERYIRANPFVPYPAPRVAVVADKDPSRLFPISPLLERFNNPQSANRVTSACGPTIYRDNLLFSPSPARAEHATLRQPTPTRVGEGRGEGSSPQTLNAFFCEPVHNMVRRLVLTPNGATFTAHRSPTGESEFLASTDNWFRPVQTRTGPDGALYVVDMYRFVIEHPRWITKERLATLDTRAGQNKGRIYRVYPPNAPPRPIEDLSPLSTPDLAQRLDQPNGVVRDLIHRELVLRHDLSAVPVLEKIAGSSNLPAARVQALCTLDGLSALKSSMLLSEITHPDARVRRNAIRVAETRLAKDPQLADATLKSATDPNPAVRFQAALSLGQLDDPRVPAALASIAAADPTDHWTRAAVLNASIHRPADVMHAIAAWPSDHPGRAELLSPLVSLIASVGQPAEIASALPLVLPTDPNQATPAQFATVASLLDTIDHRPKPLATSDLGDAAAKLQQITESARRVAADPTAPARSRAAALALLCRNPQQTDDLKLASDLLAPANPPALQSAALTALMRSRNAVAPDALISALPRISPALRAKALDALTARPQSAAALISAVDQKKLSPTDLPAATREKLLNHPDAAIREHARQTLASARPPERTKALQQFQPALKLTGNPSRGKLTFEKTCSACHQLAGLGHAVGPDLSALTDKSTGYLLTAILDPNAAVEGRFAAYQLETTDGDTYVGLLADENASALTVLQPNAMKQSVPRAAIKSLTTSRLSLMPEGLEQGMTAQDIADLIAFVQNPK